MLIDYLEDTQASELSRLISRLNQAIVSHTPYIKSVRHPKLLVKSLKELNSIIGHTKVKDAVASQVSHLISIKTRATESLTLKEDKVMLNTVLYGSPGLGKTLIGTKLAKIWYSLGYIDGSRRGKTRGLKSSEKTTTEMLEEIFADLPNPADLEHIETLVKCAIFCFYLILAFYDKLGIYWSIILITALILATYTFYRLILEEEEKSPKPSIGLVLDRITQGEKHDEDVMPANEDIITVVNRSDFVDKYVGWSDKKTLKLLDANLGKVLFVDEAYSLITSSYDTFGREVLNTINQFLSEHPGEIIIIFAGYKHLMERGIFHYQPGLCRRFMWQFECEGYNYSELFEIFIQQLKAKGWDLSDYTATKRLFRKNEDAFPNFGGDTERLTFFAELEHSREFVGSNMGINMSIGGVTHTISNSLTPKHVRRGIRKLRENNIKNTSKLHAPVDFTQLVPNFEHMLA